jgi:hypothetical protein
MNRRLRKEDVQTVDRSRVGVGPPPRRATPGTDDEKDTMRWLASTAAEAVG